VKSHLKHLSEMKAMPVGLLQDLFPAAESVGDDQRVSWGIANRWQQNPLSALNSHVVMIAFVSESASYATTAGVEDLVIEAGFLKNALFLLEVERVLVVTMPVNYCSTF